MGHGRVCLNVAGEGNFRYAEKEYFVRRGRHLQSGGGGHFIGNQFLIEMPPQDTETATWFAKEVQPHEGMLRSYLVGIARPADIDDLVQESYARLLRMREQGRMRSPRGLLFTMARNAAHDLFRRRGTARTEGVTEIELCGVLDETPGAAELVCRQQEIELLADAIEALPERCRAVFLLRQFENLPQREIAARLGIAEHTVESQLTKALRRCEEFFAAAGALPERK